MNFATEAHQRVYERVAGLVREAFGEFVRAVPDEPVFLLQLGSSLTHLIVSPWGEDDGVVLARSYVVFGADLTPELLQFLLRENDSKRFGAFGLDKDGDIFFEYCIVGSTCDKEEIKAAALAVASTSDEYDEQIVQRWGGMREVDRHKKVS